MKRGREETSHETLPWPTRLRHGGDTYIPFDLTVEILKKLPGKSLVRFRSVSELWSSTISRSRDFIDSIVTRSLTQPPRDAHIIFDHTRCFYKEYFLGFTSSTFPRITDQVSILSILRNMRQHVRGLIFCWLDIPDEKAAIYNPTTRQTFYLPETRKNAFCCFGYDPLENRYKALLIPIDSMELACQVFTLGDPTATQWRTIQGVESHYRTENIVCINGVIHYLALNTKFDGTTEYKLINFDVRYEKFYRVEVPKTLMGYRSTLINYKGKLGVVCREKSMEIWVMENATQGWSRIFFYEMDWFSVSPFEWHVLGATRGGEILFIGYINFNKLCFVYYDPKQNSMRYVDLEDIYPKGRWCSHIRTFLDHVENTMCLYETIS